MGLHKIIRTNYEVLRLQIKGEVYFPHHEFLILVSFRGIRWHAAQEV
jgi:hypothetical protein